MIPLINELFGTDYTGQEAVLSSANEIFIRNPNGKKEKRVTDSNMTLISLKGISKYYHLECQSTPDGTMEIRMWEYDTQICVIKRRIQGRHVVCRFP